MDELLGVFGEAPTTSAIISCEKQYFMLICLFHVPVGRVVDVDLCTITNFAVGRGDNRSLVCNTITINGKRIKKSIE